VQHKELLDPDHDAGLPQHTIQLAKNHAQVLEEKNLSTCVSQFLHYAAWRRGEVTFRELQSGLLELTPLPADLGMHLSVLIKPGELLDAEIALRLSIALRPGVTSVKGATAPNPEIAEKFRQRFKKLFGAGIHLEPHKLSNRLPPPPLDGFTGQLVVAKLKMLSVSVPTYAFPAEDYGRMLKLLPECEAEVAQPHKSRKARLSPEPKTNDGFFDEVCASGTSPSIQPPISPEEHDEPPALAPTETGELGSSRDTAELQKAREGAIKLDETLRKALGMELLPDKIEPLSSDLREDLLTKLAAGHTPPGLVAQLNVGRAGNIDILISDLSRITRGYSAFRAIPAPSGSGKSHLRDILVMLAQKQNLLVVQVDLSLTTSIRLAPGSEGFQDLVRSMMANLRVPETAGGSGLERLLSRIGGQVLPSNTKKKIEAEELQAQILARAPQLRGLPIGHDVATVIATYLATSSSTHAALRNQTCR